MPPPILRRRKTNQTADYQRFNETYEDLLGCHFGIHASKITLTFCLLNKFGVRLGVAPRIETVCHFVNKFGARLQVARRIEWNLKLHPKGKDFIMA